MPQYIVQVRPEQLETAALAFQAMPPALGLRVQRRVFDYLVVESSLALPPLGLQLQAVPGVVKVFPDRRMSILPVFASRFTPVVPVNLLVQRAQNPLAAATGLLGGLLNGIVGRGGSTAEAAAIWPTELSRRAVGADVADADGISGMGVKVAVLDTGFDPANEQLPGLRGESVVAGDPLFVDNNGHGSHVATTIAGKRVANPLGKGTALGVAPGAEIIIIKVLGYLLGFGSFSEIMVGMEKAANMGAKVVSMSLGGDDSGDHDQDRPEFRAVRLLTERGIVVSIAAGNCLAAGEQVWTPRGPVPIEGLLPGDSVFSYNDPRIVEEKRSLAWKARGKVAVAHKRTRQSVIEDLRVAAVTRIIANGKRPVFRMRTRTREIVVTENHPFLVQQPRGELVWVEAKDLRPGSFVVIQRKLPTNDKSKASEGLPDMLLRVLGFWLGDGWTRHRQGERGMRGEVSFACPPGEQRDQYVAMLRELFPFVNVKTDATQIHVYSQQVASDFDAWGMVGHARTKRVPRWIFELSRTQLEAFLTGYIDADGHRRAEKSSSGGGAVDSVCFAAANEGLLDDMRFICLQLGYRVSRLTKRVRTNQTIFSGRKYYDYPETIVWEFRAYPNARNNSRTVMRYRGLSLAWKCTTHLGVEVVVSVVPCGEAETYDIEVKGTHNFVAEGFVVHNSGPGDGTTGVPGGAPDALTVGAIDSLGEIAYFSSRGPTRSLGLMKPDVVAPGVNILSTTTGLIAVTRLQDGPRWAAISGTSMATPHVSGVVALAEEYARRRGGTITTADIKQVMQRAGREKDHTYGWGLITYPLLKAYLDGR